MNKSGSMSQVRSANDRSDFIITRSPELYEEEIEDTNEIGENVILKDFFVDFHEMLASDQKAIDPFSQVEDINT